MFCSMTKRHEDCTLICLPNPAKTSWILEIHLETESTGSTLRRLATHWKCTVTWQRTEVRDSVFYWDRDLLLLLCRLCRRCRRRLLLLLLFSFTHTSSFFYVGICGHFSTHFGFSTRYLQVLFPDIFPDVLHPTPFWPSSSCLLFHSISTYRITQLSSLLVTMLNNDNLLSWSFHSWYRIQLSNITPDIRLRIFITRQHKTIKEAARIARQEIRLRAGLVVYLFSWELIEVFLFNKLTSVIYTSILLLMITLSKWLWKSTERAAHSKLLRLWLL